MVKTVIGFIWIGVGIAAQLHSGNEVYFMGSMVIANVYFAAS